MEIEPFSPSNRLFKTNGRFPHRPALNPDVVADAGEVDIVKLVGRDIATDIFLHMPCGGGSKVCTHPCGNQTLKLAQNLRSGGNLTAELRRIVTIQYIMETKLPVNDQIHCSPRLDGAAQRRN